MVALAPDELAINLLFGECSAVAGGDSWFLLHLFNDGGHGFASCAPLMHLFGGPDHPRSCGIIQHWGGDRIEYCAATHPWRCCSFHPLRSGLGNDGLQGFGVVYMGEFICCIRWSVLFY